jgi:hypothetical protein
MKKIFSFILLITLIFSACNDDVNTEQKKIVTIKFTHNWDGTPVTLSDFNAFKFRNASGETLSIERLRYLVSNITLGAIITKPYNLVNVSENTDLEITFENISPGTHTLNFIFGLKDVDNIDAVYQRLNSVSFNVPEMLGGGYHYMQFDGKYKDTSNQNASFSYHTIRAVDKTDPTNLIFQDTSFEVHLGAIEIIDNTTIEIKMNIAEWFKNPNTWNLNELNSVLMPNFDAQKMMSANGASVFSLGEVN